MDTTTDLILILSTELGHIKWLLAVAVVLLAAFATAAAAAAYTLVRMNKQVAEQGRLTLFQNEADDCLESGRLEDLVALAKGRIDSHPRHTWAHWYLALGFYHKGQWHDAKRCFFKVLELDPSWRDSVDAYLEELEVKIAQSGPKLVR